MFESDQIVMQLATPSVILQAMPESLLPAADSRARFPAVKPP